MAAGLVQQVFRADASVIRSEAWKFLIISNCVREVFERTLQFNHLLHLFVKSLHILYILRSFMDISPKINNETCKKKNQPKNLCISTRVSSNPHGASRKYLRNAHLKVDLIKTLKIKMV